jgi:hypothetical protein
MLHIPYTVSRAIDKNMSNISDQIEFDNNSPITRKITNDDLIEYIKTKPDVITWADKIPNYTRNDKTPNYRRYIFNKKDNTSKLNPTYDRKCIKIMLPGDSNLSIYNIQYEIKYNNYDHIVGLNYYNFYLSKHPLTNKLSEDKERQKIFIKNKLRSTLEYFGHDKTFLYLSCIELGIHHFDDVIKTKTELIKKISNIEVCDVNTIHDESYLSVVKNHILAIIYGITLKIFYSFFKFFL